MAEASACKLADLKEKLRLEGLSATGSKAELISRLMEWDPTGAWIQEIHQHSRGNFSSSEIQHGGIQHTEDDDQQGLSSVQQKMVELYRREKELAERELAITRRELEIAQKELDIQRCQNTRRVLSEESANIADNGATERPIISQPALPRIGTTMIADLLAPFDGKSEDYETWEKQLQLLKSTYHLDDDVAKVVVGMRLKGKALEWLHSKPELISGTLKKLVDEMKNMFQHNQSKMTCRRSFESRVWKRGETFREYVHEKIILGNRVPISDDEVLEYVVEGISDEGLRDQARIQQFNSVKDLTKAFERIVLKSRGSVSGGSFTRTDAPDGVLKRTERTDKLGGKDNRVLGSVKRCYNCGARDHLSVQCPVRAEGAKCFECHEYGHIAAKCPKKNSTMKNSCAVASAAQCKHPKEVKINGHTVQALIDTGSDISIMRADEYVMMGAPRLQSGRVRFEGVGSSTNESIGQFEAEIEVDGHTYSILIRVVSDNVTRHKLLIGTDFLDSINLNVRAGRVTISPLTSSDPDKSNGLEILKIDVPNFCEVNQVDVSHIADVGVRKEIMKKYEPNKKVNVKKEMKLSLKDNPNILEFLETDVINHFQEARDEVREQANENIRKIQEENRRTFNKRRKEAHNYREGDLVAIKRTQQGPGMKFAGKNLGPYEIIKVLRNNRYVVRKIGEHEGPMQTSTVADFIKPWVEFNDDDFEEEDDTAEIKE